jgi:hypothetical protein
MGSDHFFQPTENKALYSQGRQESGVTGSFLKIWAGLKSKSHKSVLNQDDCRSALLPDPIFAPEISVGN